MAIGAYAVERDYSHYVSYASKTILAVVGTASKGPINEPTVVTSAQDLLNKFGTLKTNCFGLYASQYFLSQASKLYYVRAAGESLAAATVTIEGQDPESQPKDVVVSLVEKGTFGNGYRLSVDSGSSSGKFTISLYSNKGTVLDIIKDKTLDELSNFKDAFIEIGDTSSLATLTTGDQNYFAGGDDGIDNCDWNTAVSTLNSDTVDANLVAVPGVSDAEVITEVLKLAEERGDILYIIDPPQVDTKGVINWVRGEGDYSTNFNSSYGAVYYDWVNIYDSVNKVHVTVPPSVVVCATYAYSDRVSDLWYAPAGLNRGLIRGAISTVTKLTKNDVENLYDNNINSIYEDPQVGLVIWGQKTILKESTALDRVNVRRLMNYLKRIVTAACNYLIFEPNDRVTWNSFEMKIIPALDSIKNRRGIYEYSVVKGETIVTDEDIDNYKMPCMVMIRPTKAAEEIPIYFVITSTGADFNEVLEANGVVNN